MLLNKLRSPLAIFVLFTLLLGGTSVFIVVYRSGDGLLFLFVIPIVIVSFFYGRALYIPMMGILAGVAVWVVLQVSPSISSSLRMIFFTTITCVSLSEAFRGLSRSRQRAIAAERDQRLLAETLTEVTLALASQISYDDVLDEILRQARRLVSFKTANIALLEQGVLFCVAWQGYDTFGVEDVIANLTQPLEMYSIESEVTRSGQAVVIPDTQSDSRWVTVEGMVWIRSHLIVPITLRDRILGVLRLDDDAPGVFSMEDARRLTGLAGAAAIAIEKAQLYRDLQDHARHLEQRVQERTSEIETQMAQLEAILNSTTDGILVTDAQGAIIQLNPVAKTWLTVTLSTEDADQLREAVRGLVRRAAERPQALLELEGLDLELQVAPALLTGAGMAVVAAHDVSHLRALDRMKTNFIANVSHELRTPVTTIKLYADLMERRPERWREYHARLTDEAHHQARLVENILQLSHVDAAKLPRPFSYVSLNAIGQTVVARQVLLLAKDRGVRVDFRPSAADPMVFAASEQIQQILDNLVENGIQYTRAGGSVTLTVGQAEIDGQAWATLIVEDTGIGIPVEEQPFIFDRFYRGEQTDKMRASGSGLGLAVVAELVEQYKGYITVESQIGQGSVFSVFLPLATCQEECVLSPFVGQARSI